MLTGTHVLSLFVCTVCDKPGVLIESRGYPMHEKCAPKHWLADDKEREAFMRQVHDLAKSRGDRWGRWK
jgi:hypothetical protein